MRVGDVADHRVSVRVHHHDVRAPRDVHAAGAAVHVNVIPAALASEWDGLNHLVTGGAGRRRGGKREWAGTKTQGNHKSAGQFEESQFIAHDLFSLFAFAVGLVRCEAGLVLDFRT